MILEKLEPEPKEKIPHWNLQKAKWEHFKRLYHVNLNPKAYINQEDHNTYFTKPLLTIANKCILKNECKKKVRACHAALRKFKTNTTKENLEFFKNCRTRARRTTRNLEKPHIKKQKQCGIWFKKYWVRITAPPLKHLIKKDQTKATNKKDIANLLAETFSQNYSSRNLNQQFQSNKLKEEK